MKTSETIAYAIQKECSRFSLVEWCEEWGFTLEQFERFLQVGIDGCNIEGEKENDT